MLTDVVDRMRRMVMGILLLNSKQYLVVVCGTRKKIERSVGPVTFVDSRFKSNKTVSGIF
jgi:hypothetical protein